jgi:hypothetical protein
VALATAPAYQTILNAGKGDQLQDPDVLNTCRQVSTVMRAGDTYLTEMIGITIAKRAWPEGIPTYVDAISAKRVSHYRMDADGKLSLHHFLSSEYAAKRLQLMMEKKSEQEVILAEILNARGNPIPPSDYTDGWGGSLAQRTRTQTAAQLGAHCTSDTRFGIFRIIDIACLTERGDETSGMV